MKLPLLFPVLVVVFNTKKGWGIPPAPELHFEDNIIEDEDTDITCTFQNTACLEVNLEIKGNETLKDCKATPADCTRNTNDTKICRVEVTKEMDKMEFTCEAHFKIQSKPTKIYLQKEPCFTVCHDKLVWKEGEENSFQCSAKGFPEPTVTCQKDGIVYPAGEKFTPLRNMTGTYSCSARNFDIISKSVEVSVQYKPKVRDVTVSPPLHNEGDAVTITCEADSDPPSNYTWETPSTDVHFSPDNKTITIQRVSSSHLGTYRCTASNLHGSHSLEQELTLAARPTISAIKAAPSPEVLVGGNVTLSCEASGIPPPNFSWNHPKAMVEISKDRRNITIRNMTMEHAGNYSCTAQNKYGAATHSQQITLAVKPKVLSIYANPSTTVSENDNLTLTCVAQGVPRPTYSWHPQGTNVVLSPDSSSINILAAQKAQAGDYSCTAENKHGRDSMTKRITVTGNGGDRSQTSVTTTLTMLIFISLTFYLP